MAKKPFLCIYHYPCADGFASAWVVKQALSEFVDFFAGVHGKPAPDVTDYHVIIVDFSFPREVMERDILAKARSVLILDHHKTAIDKVSDLFYSVEGDNWEEYHKLIDALVHMRRGVFDISHSGAMLAWNYFFPDKEPPGLLQHIEARDLWQFDRLPDTKEINADLFSYPYDFDLWSVLMSCPINRLAEEGRAILRKQQKDIAELLQSQRTIKLGDFTVPVANLPYTLASEAGHILAQGQPFAATYMDSKDGRLFSLRSSSDGEDVALIAQKYGGGGHKHASGFIAPLDWFGEK